MVIVEVESVQGDRGDGSWTVVLREVGGERVLPVRMGAEGADTIELARRGLAPPRPLGADLTAAAVRALGGRVTAVGFVAAVGTVTPAPGSGSRFARP